MTIDWRKEHIVKISNEIHYPSSKDDIEESQRENNIGIDNKNNTLVFLTNILLKRGIYEKRIGKR